MTQLPAYWKTSLEDISDCITGVKNGSVELACRSAGGREVYMIRYGDANELYRTTNLSGALGAADKKCYADKTHKEYKPTVFLAGCIHGGELEGTAALLNLISIFETGADLGGQCFEELLTLRDKLSFIIIPCANPDGRRRVPFDSFVGRSLYELRYYNQGTWKDGSLCGWPQCKKVQPIKNHVEYLGGYFNDDGINLMHDDFFFQKAAETEAILKIVEEYAPDFSVLLHGGANTTNTILKPAYCPEKTKTDITALERALLARCEAEGLPFAIRDNDCGENGDPPASFNLISAMYHICGEPCVTYESNQGLGDNSRVILNHDEIYRQHLLLFSELGNFLTTPGKSPACK